MPPTQGLATVFPKHAPSYLYYTGNGTVAPSAAAQGWTHIGGSDSANGYLFDAYRSGNGTAAKMYRVTTPSSQAYEYKRTDN
jgi:hypothetical protein